MRLQTRQGLKENNEKQQRTETKVLTTKLRGTMTIRQKVQGADGARIGIVDQTNSMHGHKGTVKRL